MEKLYKGKYLIGIYKDKTNDDSLIALCDNSKEFAEFMGISINAACVALKRFFEHKTNHLRYKNELCKIYFIKN